MTIDDVYGRFVEAREEEAEKWGVAWMDPNHPDYDFEQSVFTSIINVEPADIEGAIHAGWIDDDAQMVVESRRYIVARDFNEFDPHRADMLWKLQHQ